MNLETISEKDNKMTKNFTIGFNLLATDRVY